MSKRMIPNDEELKRLYLEEKLTCKDICRKFDLSTKSSRNISERLKKMGVEIRRDAGENHHNWKGGRIWKGDHYVGIWCPTHERADNQGYVYEHTLVYEREKGVLPQKGEVLHHIDMNKKNNNIENLYLCGHKEHIAIHRSLEKLIPYLIQNDIIEFIDGEYKLK